MPPPCPHRREGVDVQVGAGAEELLLGDDGPAEDRDLLRLSVNSAAACPSGGKPVPITLSPAQSQQQLQAEALLVTIFLGRRRRWFSRRAVVTVTG